MDNLTEHRPQIDTERTVDGTMYRPGCLCGWTIDVTASTREGALEVIWLHHEEAIPEDHSELIIEDAEIASQYEPGDRFTVEVAAPGVGYKTWRVTKVEDGSLYGFVVENTVRVLEPHEVK